MCVHINVWEVVGQAASNLLVFHSRRLDVLRRDTAFPAQGRLTSSSLSFPSWVHISFTIFFFFGLFPVFPLGNSSFLTICNPGKAVNQKGWAPDWGWPGIIAGAFTILRLQGIKTILAWYWQGYLATTCRGNLLHRSPAEQKDRGKETIWATQSSCT